MPNVEPGNMLKIAIILFSLIPVVSCSSAGNRLSDKRIVGNVFIEAKWEYSSGEKIKPSRFSIKRSPGNLFPCKIGESTCCLDYQPTAFFSPEYPAKALREMISGTCVVRFDVTSNGNAVNAEIVSCSPKSIFEAATLKALRKTQLAPRIEAGEAVKTTDAMAKYTYSTNYE